MSTKEILEAVLALAPAERARLAKEIIASLDEAAVEVEPELAGEIERRIREVNSGAVKAIPWAGSRLASRVDDVPAETPLRFHPEAEDEMNVTADWYDEHSDEGSDFLSAVDETVEDIAAAPWRWPLVKGITPSTRRRLMKRYPYSVFYRIDDQGVLIVSIAHQSREDLYWLGR